jgi:hypothetical protein
VDSIFCSSGNSGIKNNNQLEFGSFLPVKKGLKQGDSLSSVLFIVVDMLVIIMVKKCHLVKYIEHCKSLFFGKMIA